MTFAAHFGMRDKKILLERILMRDRSTSKVPIADDAPDIIKSAVAIMDKHGYWGCSLYMFDDGSFGCDFHDFGPNLACAGYSTVSLVDALNNLQYSEPDVDV